MENSQRFFCMITMNRWYEAGKVINNIYPAVDHLIIIDGGSTDGTIEGIIEIVETHGDSHLLTSPDKLSEKFTGQKAIIIQSEWTDNFPQQRDKYIQAIKEIHDKTRIPIAIVSDSDEFFSENLITNLPNICDIIAQRKDIDGLRIRCRGVTKEGDKTVHETLDDFFKPLIYKVKPELHIIAISPDGKPHNVHEGFNIYMRFVNLEDHTDKGRDKELTYSHIKQKGSVWERAHFRNFYIGGGGPNLGEKQVLWKPYRELVERSMVQDGYDRPKTWHDYLAYVKKGNVNKDLKKWYIEHALEGLQRDFHRFPLSPMEEISLREKGKIDYDGSSEVREGFKYYFGILHPDEMVDVPKSVIMASDLEQNMKDRVLS